MPTSSPHRFPADFICEAIDQTRGWFYSLLAVNTLVFERAPYRNVVCLAHIVDQDGLKMSKSRGNVIDPWSVLLDARRRSPALVHVLVGVAVDTEARVRRRDRRVDPKFLLTLWNTCVVLRDLREPRRLVARRPPGQPSEHVLDRWIVSRLHGTVATVTDALESFDAFAGAQALSTFVDDLSNWYVRRSRPRFWKSADPAAHATLHQCLVTISLLLAPYCPFVADELHRNLARRQPFHPFARLAGGRRPRASTASSKPRWSSPARSRRWVAARAAEAKIGVRQPLPRAIVAAAGRRHIARRGRRTRSQSELNVKRLEHLDSLEGLLTYHVLPNFRALGPRARQAAARASRLRSPTSTAPTCSERSTSTGACDLDVEGTEVELGPDDVEVRAEKHEELSLVQGGGVAVALDLHPRRRAARRGHRA